MIVRSFGPRLDVEEMQIDAARNRFFTLEENKRHMEGELYLYCKVEGLKVVTASRSRIDTLLKLGSR